MGRTTLPLPRYSLNNVRLSVDNAVTVQSARSTSDYDYQQSSSKYGAGVSYSVGAQNGMTVDLAAGSNRGTGSGSDSTNVAAVDAAVVAEP